MRKETWGTQEAQGTGNKWDTKGQRGHRRHKGTRENTGNTRGHRGQKGHRGIQGDTGDTRGH